MKQPSLALSPSPPVRHYYVDESGDPVLFGDKGRVIIGTEGCSSHFFLGLVSVFNPEALERELKLLHKALLADPALNKKKSFLEKNKKTFYAFHAKDDLPEVREQVFKLLVAHDLKFFAVAKDKSLALDYIIENNRRDPDYRYGRNDLYDHLVKTLFLTRLHREYEYNIHFSRRGPSDRTAALKAALLAVQEKAKQEHKLDSVGTINIFPPASSIQCVNLQATDYCLWALHRFYTKGEDRYLRLIWPLVSVIYDLDKRFSYTRKKHPFMGC